MIRILYVEDNEDNIYMLRRRLERKGIEVIVAQDGEQRIAAAARERPDLILMDLSLPVIDGWEAARRLKGAPETAAIPIIALGARHDRRPRAGPSPRAATITTPSPSTSAA